MDTLKLSMVSARGGGVHIHDKGVDLTIVFGCPFTRASAKVLGVDWLYSENGGGLRGFDTVDTGIRYNDADVSFKRADGQSQYDLGISCPVDNIQVMREEKGNQLRFRVKFPTTDVKMLGYLQEARRDPCYEVVIQGKQKEFDFEPKEKKPRGRPKKDKAAKEK